MNIHDVVIVNKFDKSCVDKVKMKFVKTLLAFLLIASIILAISVLSPSFVANAQNQTSYTVQPGDYLWGISQKFNTTVGAIMELNNMTNTDIRVGQVLEIPAAGYRLNIRYIEYAVRYGNTLGSLAENFGSDIRSIRSLNGLTGDAIYPGQILKIPAEYVNYRVVSGDTLYGISTRFGTTVRKIMLFNRMTDYSVYVGQVLHIPYIPQVPEVRYAVHTVQAGENAWIISKNYGISMYELMAANNLSQSSQLSIGQSLRVPVYTIPVRLTPGPQYGEYLDWFTEAQYLFPIGKRAEVVDFATGKRFSIERTIGASHADCEPLTSADAEVIRELWGGSYSWGTRAVLVIVDGRKIAASVASMPHGIEYIANNSFNGHFDIHFKNSKRHKDDAVDEAHQAKVRIAAGAES